MYMLLSYLIIRNCYYLLRLLQGNISQYKNCLFKNFYILNNSNTQSKIMTSNMDTSAFFMGNFLTTHIEFTEQNHASVFFAHLQNVLKDLSLAQKLQSNVQFNKADRVLYDIYLQHKKLQANYETVQKGIKQLMTQFSTMIQQCKNDREQLEKSMEDRQNIMNKLKDVNQQLYQSAVQNQVLRKTVSQLKQLNELISEKNSVLEEQAQNYKFSTLGMEDYNRINKQYDRLLESNQDMRKDLIEITSQTQMLEIITTPFKICCLAIAQDPELKQKIWAMAKTGAQKSNKQNQLEALKNQYNSFKYENFTKMQESKQI